MALPFILAGMAARALFGRVVTALAARAGQAAISNAIYIEATGGAGGVGLAVMGMDWAEIADDVRSFDSAEAAVLAQSVASNFFSGIERSAARWRTQSFHSTLARANQRGPSMTWGPLNLEIAQDERGQVMGLYPIKRNGEIRELPFVGLVSEGNQYLMMLTGSQCRYIVVKRFGGAEAQDRWARSPQELPRGIQTLIGRLTNDLNLLWANNIA